MLKTPIARGVALATLGATLAIPTMAQAAFIEDTKAGLELRNFYFNRDWRQDGGNSGQSKADEWAQGFLLRVESGYTEGTVGFGVDALGLLGVKLDSSPDRVGTGLLPSDVQKVNGAPDDYSQLGLTAKARVSKSILKVGTLQPKNMAIATSDSRLLPATMRGAQLVSNEIDNLTLDVAYFDQFNDRNSTDDQDITINTTGKGIDGNKESDEFVYLGGTYKLTKDLSASYYYSNLEDNYKQHAVNLIHVLPIADGQSLKTDLRYQRSKDDGNTNVDNKAFGAMVTYSISGHSFGLGYQKMSGDTGFAYIGGGVDPYLVNYVQIGDFAQPDEKSWQARYDYNFAAIGIPGLTFMTRYVTGDNFERAGVSEGKEWERDTDIGYVIQDGALKNLGLKWRNATFRSNGAANDIDENRLIVSYTIPLM
ncbi:OprD family porin [Stutzerimonas degradans]|uniref:Outer membrane porin, OprD family n=1 Tax=Stutzerimonas degradans TaxID=2968968 RepID=A0A8E2QBI3_9GAMM|nr:OprD family porin [Stutzerimonas degradans]MCQ4275604.1 OprD family porin [Stutzerimonas degradans]PNF75442.1 outer membrane porin, OprD family [Stutzerimonas degradans]QPT22846.1 OprD family porin [Stutzerimonas degradans]